MIPNKLSAEGGTGLRLDKFLAHKIPALSRTQIQEMIKIGHVLVNGGKVKSSFILEGTEYISYTLPEPKTVSPELIPQNITLDVLYEDECLIVVNKQAGLTVHPGTGKPDGTLVNGLIYHFQSLSNLNGALRPGIVHRLDEDTTGVILIAKSNTAHRKLSAQFEQRKVQKLYSGITWGKWEKREGIINDPIGRSRNDPRLYILSQKGKTACTKYKIIHQNKYLSHLEFSPKTGRTHQIRVHCTSRGHPIFADKKYSGGYSRTKGFLPEISKMLHDLLKNFKGHALHASQLKFRHPETDKLVCIRAPLPDYFNKLSLLMRDKFE